MENMPHGMQKINNGKCMFTSLTTYTWSSPKHPKGWSQYITNTLIIVGQILLIVKTYIYFEKFPSCHILHKFRIELKVRVLSWWYLVFAFGVTPKVFSYSEESARLPSPLVVFEGNMDGLVWLNSQTWIEC